MSWINQWIFHWRYFFLIKFHEYSFLVQITWEMFTIKLLIKFCNFIVLILKIWKICMLIYPLRFIDIRIKELGQIKDSLLTYFLRYHSLNLSGWTLFKLMHVIVCQIFNFRDKERKVLVFGEGVEIFDHFL